MEQTMRIWRLPGPKSVLSGQRICEQVQGEAVHLETEIYYFVLHKETLIVAIYPSTEEVNFVVGSRIDQLVMEEGCKEASGEFIYGMFIARQRLQRMSSDEDLEIILEFLPMQTERSH